MPVGSPITSTSEIARTQGSIYSARAFGLGGSRLNPAQRLTSKGRRGQKTDRARKRYPRTCDPQRMRSQRRTNTGSERPDQIQPVQFGSAPLSIAACLEQTRRGHGHAQPQAKDCHRQEAAPPGTVGHAKCADCREKGSRSQRTRTGEPDRQCPQRRAQPTEEKQQAACRSARDHCASSIGSTEPGRAIPTPVAAKPR